MSAITVFEAAALLSISRRMMYSLAEPDARKYVCESCGKPKVYGAAELAMMGLTF